MPATLLLHFSARGCRRKSAKSCCPKTLRKALSQAERWGMIPMNPAASVSAPLQIRHDIGTEDENAARLLARKLNMQRRQLTNAERLRYEEWSTRRIASVIGVSQMTVVRWVGDSGETDDSPEHVEGADEKQCPATAKDPRQGGEGPRGRGQGLVLGAASSGAVCAYTASSGRHRRDERAGAMQCFEPAPSVPLRARHRRIASIRSCRCRRRVEPNAPDILAPSQS
jgi:hypothetical protein